MKFPGKKKLKEMDRKLKKMRGTQMVGPSSSSHEKFRWELCQNLVKFMLEKELSQVEFAKLLEIDQARISEIVHHKIDKVSTDKLISYNESINPQVKFKIA